MVAPTQSRTNKKVGSTPTSSLKDVAVRNLTQTPELEQVVVPGKSSEHGLKSVDFSGWECVEIKNRLLVQAVSICDLLLCSLIVVGGGSRLAPKPSYACC
jgi:hypothetical protein